MTRPRPHSSDPKLRLTLEQIRALRDAVDAQANEVLAHLYRTVLQTPEFTLKDGTKCRVESFYEPEVNSDGELTCGFDVQMADGAHLEFTVNHTGWGKSFVQTAAPKVKGKGSGRQR